MILFISPSVHLSLLRGFYPSGSLIKMLHTGLIAHMHATWLIHLILHELIILTVPSEEYKLWNYSLCNSAQPPGVSLNFLRSKYTPQQPILLLLILLHTLPQGSKQASKQASKQTNKQTNKQQNGQMKEPSYELEFMHVSWFFWQTDSSHFHSMCDVRTHSSVLPSQRKHYPNSK